TPDPGADGYTARVTRVVQRGEETVSTDTVSSTYAPRVRIECRVESPAPADEPPGPVAPPPVPDDAIRIPGLPEFRIPVLPGN
ncbi:hypothetical protein G6021_09815, partial [Dietzia sp. CW19]|nr:hypothetical protein [Dietzia sp. CW19]